MRRTLALAVALLWTGPAFADLVAAQRVEKEVLVRAADGTEKIERRPADRVKPGQQVIYTLSYENPSSSPAGDVVLIMPVPRETTYVEGSVTGPGASVTFSADGGETYVARGRLVVTEDGRERAATNGDITHVKWTLAGALAPKGRGEVSFRGIVK